jgi:hypothetical protein
MKISSKIFVVAFKLPRLFKLGEEGDGRASSKQGMDI